MPEEIKTEGELLALAWRKWLDSEEGQKVGNPNSLPPAERPGHYLQNRLWWAFMAGARAAEEIAAKTSPSDTKS